MSTSVAPTDPTTSAPHPTAIAEPLAPTRAAIADRAKATKRPAPDLAPPPAPTAASRRTHQVFLKVNRWSTLPLLRAGVGPWLGTPIGGYLLLLRVRGRRSGALREVPLSYLIAEEAAWVCAGMGPGAQWYQNLLADPAVEVVLPGRTVACRAEDVRDPGTRQRIMPALVRALGLPGGLGGVDPRRATDDEILEAYGWVPLISLRPVGGPLVAGPDDPGGTAWMWRQAVVLGLLVAMGRWATGLTRWFLSRR